MSAIRIPDSAFRPFPATRWFGWVQAYRSMGGDVAQAIYSEDVGGDTIEDALAEAFRVASRYLAMGWESQIKGLTEVCSRCEGSGLARPDRNHRYLGRRNPHCHRCHGAGSFRRLGTIDVKPDPTAYMTI